MKFLEKKFFQEELKKDVNAQPTTVKAFSCVNSLDPDGRKWFVHLKVFIWRIQHFLFHFVSHNQNNNKHNMKRLSLFSARRSCTTSAFLSSALSSRGNNSAIYSPYTTAVVTEKLRSTINTPTRDKLTVDDIPKTKNALPILGNTLEFLRDLPNFHRLLEKYAQEGDLLKKVIQLDFLLHSCFVLVLCFYKLLITNK